MSDADSTGSHDRASKALRSAEGRVARVRKQFGRSAACPQTGQHQPSNQLQQASALQQWLQQQQLQQGLQRRTNDQPSSVLPNEPSVPAGADTHGLLAHYQLQAQQLAAAPR